MDEHVGGQTFFSTVTFAIQADSGVEAGEKLRGLLAVATVPDEITVFSRSPLCLEGQPASSRRELRPWHDFIDWLASYGAIIEFNPGPPQPALSCRITLPHHFPISVTASNFVSAALAVRRIIDDEGER